MSPSFNQVRSLRKALMGALATAICALAAPAEARPGEAVVVASTSPSYSAGSIVGPGEALRIERGASITLLEESGRLRTITTNVTYRPAQDANAPRRDGGSVVTSLSTMLRQDRQVRASGGVRNLTNSATTGCGAEPETLGFDALQGALQRGCEADAVTIMADWAAQDVEPQLFVHLLPPPEAAPSTMQIEVQANFDAYLYCRMRRSDASVIALTPDPGALPLRLPASQNYALTLPPSPEGSGRAVQCMAVGAKDANAPDIGNWPAELDPQRIEDAGATVITTLLALPRR